MSAGAPFICRKGTLETEPFRGAKPIKPTSHGEESRVAEEINRLIQKEEGNNR